MLSFIGKSLSLMTSRNKVIRYSTLITDKWPTSKVRQTFIDYFCVTNQHKFVESSSVIPAKGSGTYFTNAGMNQFKSIILGESNPNDIFDFKKYKGLANSQKCIRIGRLSDIPIWMANFLNPLIEPKVVNIQTWIQSAKTTITTRFSKCSATGRSAHTTKKKHVVSP